MADVSSPEVSDTKDLIVTGPNFAAWNYNRLRCAVGKNGIAAAADKREGDGMTPAGRWPMRRVFYRADRMPPVISALPVQEIKPSDGWCDDPADSQYNTFFTLRPGIEHAERFWREDGLYDVIVVLAYNDAPVVPGMGSAIFLHVTTPDMEPTNGCIALPLDDLLTVLREAAVDSAVVVPPTAVE